MGFGISFAPLVPPAVLWTAVGVAVAVAALLVFVRSRGAWARAVALAFLALALANPSLTREDREALPSVAAVVLDRSPSQTFGDRQQQTEAARAALTERLGRIKNLEVRVIEAGQSDGETDGTRLFSALSAGLADVPPDRVAGAILVTDGRVHDVPARKWRRSASRRRSMRSSPGMRTSATAASRWSRRRASALSASRRPSSSGRRIPACAAAPPASR